MPKKKQKEKAAQSAVKESKIKLTQKKFEEKVEELAKEGLTAEKIGEKLRQEGIHPQDYDEKISKILKEKNIYEIPDVKNLQTKLEKIESHASKNKQDKRAIRERSRIFSRLRRLKKYHGIKVR